MTALDRKNAAVMKSAQIMRDVDVPDAPPEFLQTKEGERWVNEAADDLICGYAVKANGSTVIDKWTLGPVLGEIATAKIVNGDDEDESLGQILHAVAGGDMERAQAALYMLLSKKDIEEAAKDICREKADVYVELMMESKE